MPAVQLATLNQQINDLTPHFADPASFRREVEGLLLRYSDLSYKPGRAVYQSDLSPSSYHTAPVVMRRLQQHLAGLATLNPELALPAADALWQSDQTEMRQLAAILLGNVPIPYANEVFERLKTWPAPGTELAQLETLFEKGSLQIRRENPQQWLEQIRAWLDETDVNMYRLGVIAMLPLANDPAYENLPAIFNALSPTLARAPAELQRELRDLLTVLAHRSPAETGYFLRQVMGINASRTMLRLVRRILPEFPEEVQARLRSALANQQRE
jgi:hypothetical protein